ncbi:MAG: hypothetical protein K2W88_06970 [Pararheinheimera sp.]|nr:hypothetical protein [Rheinheimera sp.]
MEHAIDDLKQLPVSAVMGFVEKYHPSHAETLYNNHSGLNLNAAIRFLILADVLSKFSTFKYFLVHTMMLEDSIDVFNGKIHVGISKFAELYESLSPEALGILLGAAIQAPGQLDFDPDVANQLHSKDKQQAVYALIALLGYLMPFDRNDFSKFVESRTESIFETTTHSGDYVSARFNNGIVETLYEFIGSPAAPVLFSPEGKYYGISYSVDSEVDFAEQPVIEGEVEALEILIPNMLTNAEIEEAEPAYLRRIALIQALPNNQDLDLAKLATLPDSVLAKMGDPATHHSAFNKLRPTKVSRITGYSKQCRDLIEPTILSLKTDLEQFSEPFMVVGAATVQRLIASMRSLKPAEDGHDHTAHFNVVSFMGEKFVESKAVELPIKIIEASVEGEVVFVPFDRALLTDYLKSVGMPYNTKRIKEGALIYSLYNALDSYRNQYQLSLQEGALDEEEDSDEADTESFDGDSRDALGARDIVALHNLSLTIQVAGQDYEIPTVIEHGLDLPLNNVVPRVNEIATDAANTIKHLVGQIKACESDGRIDKLVELGYDRDTLEALDPEISENYLNRLLAQHSLKR